MGAHAVAAGPHLPLHWPLSLWWKLIRYPGTHGHCDFQVCIVYLTLVSLGTYLSNYSLVGMKSCVSCEQTVLVRD